MSFSVKWREITDLLLVLSLGILSVFLSFSLFFSLQLYSSFFLSFQILVCFRPVLVTYSLAHLRRERRHGRRCVCGVGGLLPIHCHGVLVAAAISDERLCVEEAGRRKEEDEEDEEGRE